MIPTTQDWPAAPPAPPPPPPTAPSPRPRRRRSVLVAVVAAAALVAGGAVGLAIGLATRGGGSGANGSPAPSTAASAAVAQARALYRQALAAANASTGFHYVAVTSGDTNQKFVGDAGQAGGTQVITTDSTYGQEQFTLVLDAGTVYFQGNGPALRDQLGVPAASASTLAGRWISVAGGDGPYGVIAPGITVADQVGETTLIPLSAQTTSAGVRIAGTVPALQAGASGTAHLDVAAGSHLPTSYVVSITGGGTNTTSTTTFGRWGTAPAVTAPAGAVAWSTLGASSPPGGYGSGGTSASPTPSA